MKKIILDTNVLLIPTQFKIDIFSEIDRICLFKYQLYILDKTIDELGGIIKNQKGKHKQAAKIALMLIKNKKIKKIKTREGNVDELIISIVDKDHIVATLDTELRRKLRNRHIPMIVMRGKQYLVLQE